MAGIKISNLPAVPVAPALTDLLAEVQPAVGGTTYKVTLQQIYNLFSLSSGSVNAGTINQLAYYAASGKTVSGLATANNGVLVTSAGGVPSISSTLPANLVTTDPTLTQGVATKNYVDTVATGLEIQPSVVAATTGALTATYANGASGVGATLTNAGAFAVFALDGVSPTVGQRVLIKNQASALQNGIYTVTNTGDAVSVNWVITRATDYDQPAEIQPGDLVVVDGGTVNGHLGFIQTATVTAVGTDAINWSQFGQNITLPLAVTSGGTGLSSTTINQILYSSANNVIAGLATANSSMLQTNTTGVPSLQSVAWTNYTPVMSLAGGAGNVVPVYTTNEGRYCRIGNMVVVNILFSGDGGAEGAGTGQVQITLPVAVSASAATAAYRPVGYALNGATEMILIGYVSPGTSLCTLGFFNTISTSQALSGANQNNTTRQVQVQFVYEATAL